MINKMKSSIRHMVKKFAKYQRQHKILKEGSEESEETLIM